jgi:hypothetical protein
MVPVPPAGPTHLFSAIGLAAVVFFALSIYMLIDPLGLYCFFVRKRREDYAASFRRGWAVTAMALVFVAVTGYLLFSLIRQ